MGMKYRRLTPHPKSLSVTFVVGNSSLLSSVALLLVGGMKSLEVPAIKSFFASFVTWTVGPATARSWSHICWPWIPTYRTLETTWSSIYADLYKGELYLEAIWSKLCE
jgi:hypothetical protein